MLVGLCWASRVFVAEKLYRAISQCRRLAAFALITAAGQSSGVSAACTTAFLATLKQVGNEDNWCAAQHSMTQRTPAQHSTTQHVKAVQAFKEPAPVLVHAMLGEQSMLSCAQHDTFQILHLCDIQRLASLFIVHRQIQPGTEHVLVVLCIHSLHHQSPILRRLLAKAQGVSGELASQLNFILDCAILHTQLTAVTIITGVPADS